MKRENLLKVLHSLRTPNGLYRASLGEYYYKYTWIRDTYFCVLPELKDNHNYYQQTYHSLLDYYHNMENKHKKLESLIASPTKYGYEFPHPRFYPDTLDEIDQSWAFKQLDNFGQVLHGIWLGEQADIKIIRNKDDEKIINLLIKALEAVDYANCANSSYWEEEEDIRLSSTGSCVCGLTAIRTLGFDVDQKLIDQGHNVMNLLASKESVNKEHDLGTLSLIYPHNIIDSAKARQILCNVETNLLRDKGVIRYKNDKYYNLANVDEARERGRLCHHGLNSYEGNEAEWVFGFAFLGLSYHTLGDTDKAMYYLKKLAECESKEGYLPELYYSKTNIYNDNNPLGWTNAMAILLMDALECLEV